MSLKELLEYFSNKPQPLRSYPETERVDLLAMNPRHSVSMVDTDFEPIAPIAKYGDKYSKKKGESMLIAEMIRRMQGG